MGTISVESGVENFLRITRPSDFIKLVQVLNVRFFVGWGNLCEEELRINGSFETLCQNTTVQR